MFQPTPYEEITYGFISILLRIDTFRMLFYGVYNLYLHCIYPP